MHVYLWIKIFQQLNILISSTKTVGRLKIEVLHEKLNSTCTTNFYFYRLAGTSDSGIMIS